MIVNGAKVKAARIKAEVSVMELATYAGFQTEGAVRQLEGKETANLNIHIVTAIAKKLKVKPVDLGTG